MPLRRVPTPVEQLKPFERGRIVGLREAGWTYRRIVAHVGHNVSVVSRCFQHWSVEHSHTRRPGSGRRPTQLSIGSDFNQTQTRIIIERSQN